MSDKFSPSSNFAQAHIVGGVASDDVDNHLLLKLDPVTERLLVSATVDAFTGVTDGEAVDGDDTGTLMLGTDGSNYQVVATDTSGHLQVDVLSITGGGDATAANQTTIIGHVDGIEAAVDGIEGLLTTIDTDTGAINTAVTGVTSAEGVNTETDTTGALWATDTWTGAGEQNDLQYVAVSLQTDEAGILYFDFSNDGTNWSTFPVAGFTIASGTHEYHAAHKAGRYFRPRFVGEGGRSYFRLYSYYTNSQVQLNAPLNFAMSADSDGQIVKSAHVVQYTPTPSTVAENSFDVPSLTRHRELRTRDQRALKLQRCDDYTEFTAINNDTDNLADTLNHIYGTGAVTFDKVNGAGNTVFAGIQDTITEVDGQEIFEMGSFVGMNLYLPSIGDVVSARLRIGTDSSNYNEWEWSVDSFTAATWLPLRMSTAQPSGYAGNGWNPAAITYVAVVVEFSAEADTLSGIIVDNIFMVGGRVTDATTDATVSTSISSPNINIHKVGNKNVDTGAGNVGTGTMRMTLATDQAVVPVSDNGGSLTIDGTVTANLSATDNAVLDSIDADLTTIIGHVDGIEGSVDGIEGLLTTIDADTGGILTAVQLIDNTVATISATDVLRVAMYDDSDNQITSFGGGTQYNIDTALGATDTTTLAGVVRDDSLSTLTEADGDVTVLRVSSTGALHVTGGGGGTEYTEDVATANPIVGTATLIERDDALSTVTPIEGDWIGLRGTAEGALWVQDFNSDQVVTDLATIIGHIDGIEGSVDGIEGLLTTIDADTSTMNTNLATVAGAVAGSEMQSDILSIIPGTGATNLGKAEDALHASGHTGVMALAVRNTSNATLSGTQLDYTPIGVNAEGSPRIVGDRAHDAVDANNPVKIGGRAQEPTAAPDEVANDDRVDRLHDRVGRAAIYQGYPRWYAVINASSSGDNTLLAAQGAGKKILVTSMLIVSDGTVDVRFESGASGTALTGQMPLQAREGFNGCDVWGSFETAANALLNLELSAAVNVHGWIAGNVIDD